MPFCEASRVTMPTSGLRERSRPSARSSCSLFDALAAQILAGEVLHDVAIVARIPFPVIDAVQYPDHGSARARNVACMPMPRARLGDLARVSGTHRGHRVGKFYAGFQGVDDAELQIGGIELRLRGR